MLENIELLRLAEDFEESPHDAIVWIAFEISHRSGEPLPRVLQKRLDEILLKQAEREIEKFQNGGREQRRQKQLRTGEAARLIALEVQMEIDYHEVSINQASKTVAKEFGLASESVRSIYNRNRDSLPSLDGREWSHRQRERIFNIVQREKLSPTSNGNARKS